jgi:hypothetical protein
LYSPWGRETEYVVEVESEIESMQIVDAVMSVEPEANDIQTENVSAENGPPVAVGELEDVSLIVPKRAKWKRNVLKNAVNNGQEYVNRSGKDVMLSLCDANVVPQGVPELLQKFAIHWPRQGAELRGTGR